MKRRKQKKKKSSLDVFQAENKICRLMSWVIDTKNQHMILLLGRFWKKLIKHTKTILNSLKLLFFGWHASRIGCDIRSLFASVGVQLSHASHPSYTGNQGELQTDTMLLFYPALSISHLSWSNIRKHQAVVEHTESIFITKCKCHIMQMLSSSSPWSSSPQDEAVNVTFIAQEASTVFSGMAHRAHNEPFKGFCLWTKSKPRPKNGSINV